MNLLRGGISTPVWRRASYSLSAANCTRVNSDAGKLLKLQRPSTNNLSLRILCSVLQLSNFRQSKNLQIGGPNSASSVHLPKQSPALFEWPLCLIRGKQNSRIVRLVAQKSHIQGRNQQSPHSKVRQKNQVALCWMGPAVPQ